MGACTTTQRGDGRLRFPLGPLTPAGKREGKKKENEGKSLKTGGKWRKMEELKDRITPHVTNFFRLRLTIEEQEGKRKYKSDGAVMDLSIYLSIYLSILSILSIYLSLSLSSYLSIELAIYLSS